MSRIRSKNTRPELFLRKELFKKGLRFRVHTKIKGTPDIVFLKKKLSIFVNGCFWHGHNCKLDHTPKSNTSFWKEKILNNIERDKNVTKILCDEGWKTLTVWECEVKNSLPGVVKKINKLMSP